MDEEHPMGSEVRPFSPNNALDGVGLTSSHGHIQEKELEQPTPPPTLIASSVVPPEEPQPEMAPSPTRSELAT